MIAADVTRCPECEVPLEPTRLAPDPDARVCPRCGSDRLAIVMQAVAGKAMVWDYRDVRLYIRWGQLPPLPSELTSARRLVPAMKRVPVAMLLEMFCREPAWLLGEMPSQDGRALFVRARELGLTPELVYLPETRGTSQDPNAHDEAEEPVEN